MTYIIAEPCKGTCDTSCVEVCPVDCIHGPIPLDERDGVSYDPLVSITAGQLFTFQ